MHTVWVVTYIDKNNELQMMIFDNPFAANSCYRHFCKIYGSAVAMNKCEVYGSFMVAGNESVSKVSEYCVECDCFYHDCRGNEEPCLGFIPKDGSKYKTVELEVANRTKSSINDYEENFDN